MQEPNYKELYFKLFNRINDIIEELKQIHKDAEEEVIGAEKKEQ